MTKKTEDCPPHHMVIETHEQAVSRWQIEDSKKKRLEGHCKKCGEKKTYPLSDLYTKWGQGGGSKNVFSLNGNEQWSRKHETVTDPAEFQANETQSDAETFQEDGGIL
tara:strand:+ start:178 stop:501 length:324 start_codon:yes stop_codon:yes gene_type:complete